MSYICKNCKKKYSSMGNLKRHNKKPCKIKITSHRCVDCKKYFSAECSLKYHRKHNCPKILKKRVIIKSKAREKIEHQTCNDLVNLNDIIDIERQNIPKKIVVGDNILEILNEKMGEQEHLNFFLTNILSKQYGKIIESVYLTGRKSDDYPMACSDKQHFRFLNESGKLINDLDGEILIQTLVNCLQNALLKTSNKLIMKYIGTNEDIAKLYDFYDIRKIQNSACEISKPINRKKIKDFLIKRVINPNHSFFSENESVMELHKKYIETLLLLTKSQEKLQKLNKSN